MNTTLTPKDATRSGRRQAAVPRRIARSYWVGVRPATARKSRMKVRVVEVAEVKREPRPVGPLASSEGLEGLVQLVALQDPLRPDADVPREQPLERAHRHRLEARDVAHCGPGAASRMSATAALTSWGHEAGRVRALA